MRETVISVWNPNRRPFRFIVRGPSSWIWKCMLNSYYGFTPPDTNGPHMDGSMTPQSTPVFVLTLSGLVCGLVWVITVSLLIKRSRFSSEATVPSSLHTPWQTRMSRPNTRLCPMRKKNALLEKSPRPRRRRVPLLATRLRQGRGLARWASFLPCLPCCFRFPL